MKLLQRIKALAGFGARTGGVNPTLEGGLPTSWPWQWWQRNFKPYGADSCATVYACAAAYAQTIAACAADHWIAKSDGGKELVTTSALSRILRSPNSYQTRSDFILNMVQQLMLNGNAYVVGFRNARNEFDNIHLLDSQSTHPYVEPESKTVFYALGGNPMIQTGIDMLIPARDIMHVRLYTPRHPLLGVSPVEYATLAVSSNTSISAHQATFFNNMSRPSGVITTDQVLNREQLTSLRAAWHDQSQGLNSGQVPILHAGMKWQSLSINSQDAQLVEAFRMSVEDIARAFRVPLPLIGDNRYSTFNNVEQLSASWLSTGLGFVLEHIELAFAKFFQLPPSEFVNFDTDTLLRTDFAGRIDALTKGITGGLYSPNEARAKEGLAAVRYGEEPRLQAQVVPLSQVAAIESIDTAPSAPSADPVPNPEDIQTPNGADPEDEPDDEEPDDEEKKIIAIAHIRNSLKNKVAA